jgi:hypothetical protein
LSCNSGACGPPPVCRPTGGGCSSSSSCCNPSQFCAGPRGTVCRSTCAQLGEEAASSRDCCPGLFLGTRGSCSR